MGGVTMKELQVGAGNWLCCFVCALVGCYLCCWIPLIVEPFKDFVVRKKKKKKNYYRDPLAVYSSICSMCCPFLLPASPLVMFALTLDASFLSSAVLCRSLSNLFILLTPCL